MFIVLYNAESALDAQKLILGRFITEELSQPSNVCLWVTSAPSAAYVGTTDVPIQSATSWNRSISIRYCSRFLPRFPTTISGTLADLQGSGRDGDQTLHT